MDTVRRNKHLFGNKSADDIQLSSLSSSSSAASISGLNSEVSQSGGMKSSLLEDASNSLSGGMKSSLLDDASNSSSVPYDMTLIDLDTPSYPEKVPAADKAGTRW